MRPGILPVITLLAGSLIYGASAFAFEPTKLANPEPGTSQTNPISFTTYGDEGTTWTQIWVYNQSTGIAQPPVSYYHTSINCAGTKCAHTFTTPLAPGYYLWSAQSWAPDNGGTYSPWTTPYSSFSVDLPGQVNPVAPPEFGAWYNGAPGGNSFPYSFQFRWEDDPLATDYEIYAIDSANTVTNLTVPRVGGNVACNGFCSWYDATAVQLNAGPVQWWVRASANGIVAPWSTSTRFWEGGLPGSTYGATIVPFTGLGSNRLNLGGVAGVFLSNWDVPAFAGQITDTWIYASQTKGGYDLHNQQYPVNNRSATITGFGTGSLWIRYWFEVGGIWYYTDFQYLNN